MPFLRRRGVMASESDMRRHTTLFESKPQADFLPAQSTTHPPEYGPTPQAPESRKLSTGPNPAIEAARASQDFFDRPDSPPIQDETPRHRRFNMLRFRNASDSQLATRWRQLQQAEKPPPMPEPPTIITTAPTFNSLGGTLANKKSGVRIPLRMRRSSDVPRGQPDHASRLQALSGTRKEKKSITGQRTESPAGTQVVTFDDSSKTKSASMSAASATSATSEDHGLTLPATVQRLSESSRSEGGSIEHVGSIPQNPSSSTLFRFGRRKPKQPEPLFPLGHLPQRSKTPSLSVTGSNSPLPRNSTSTTHVSDISRPSTSHDRSTPLGSPGHGLNNLANKMTGSPATVLFRPSSRNSGQYSPTRSNTVLRGRSSTMSSLSESFIDPQQLGASRTSSSTGRKSFGDLLGLGRMRQNTDLARHGTLTPATPISNTSKANSLQLVREAVVLPERRDDDTPAKYLARVEGVLARGTIASALSKENNPFYAAVLRSYMRSFSFFEEPMDMAIRKLLMEAELPKETQQIDRCLQAFANRYHECNPGIYATPDQAYFIAFSLLILHTDVFNKNNKYKMQKADYIKNTRVEGIFDDVLECFYDNISYTPFIHLEDDFHVNGERAGSIRLKKKSVFPSAIAEPNRRARDLIDPYTLILDGKLDILRPPLRDQIPLEEHYSYLGTANRLNLKELQKTFFKTGVLQIVSARSRPDAFMTEKTQNNPDAAHPGIVDIKVTKVGVLWRKEANKRRTRSPWQEWGAILTGAQLYFFRNAGWVKSLVHQHEVHVKAGHDGVPLIFKPPLENFKPDALMSTEGAVALWDCNYKRHKNAFVYVRHGGLEEVLLAQSEEDRNDWLAKLNYAAAFRTSGVRMRGVVGGNYEGQSRRAIRRLDSANATQHVQTPTGEVAINRSKIDHQMAQDILVARQAMMRQKIEEAEEKLEASQKHVDTQLRNARHLLVLAPIQDRTREQVCNGAAKIIAQLKWSRMDFWRLKCHRDVLAMDLAEERETSGDLKDMALDASLTLEEANEDESIISQQAQESAAALSSDQTADLMQQSDTESLNGEAFHTPLSSATPAIAEDRPDSSSSQSSTRKNSLSSVASLPIPSDSHHHDAAASPSQPETILLDETLVEDEQERHVLEEAGLLEPEPERTANRRPSSAYTTDDIPDRGKRGSISGADKESSDKGKIRRSLRGTLRESAGHLSHRRSKKGRESTSAGGLADDSTRDEVLSRGDGSFTVHGKKASVINFGNELQGIATDEHLKTRKQSHQGSDLAATSSGSIDELQSTDDVGESSERRGSITSASTATARSFRDLHRKYSSSRAKKAAAGGNLVVPADDDSDAALSFSDGRHSPLPPLDDDDNEDENPSSESPPQTQFYTPDPPSSPVRENDTAVVEEEGKDEPSSLPSSAVQEVNA